MTVYDKLPRPPGLHLTPDQLRVYMKCNGARSLDEVVAQTGLAHEAVLNTALALQNLGLLRSTSDHETAPPETALTETAASSTPPPSRTTESQVRPGQGPPDTLTPPPPAAPVPAAVPAAAPALDHERVWQATSEVYDRRLGRAAASALNKLKKDLNGLDPAATRDGVKQRLSLAFGPGAVALFEEILGDGQR